MSHPTSTARLFVLGLLFSVATSLAITASASAEQRRSTRLQEEAQALAGLSRSDLTSYFTARRQLERRGAEQRMAQLRSLEDCLQRQRPSTTSAEACLEQVHRQRRQEQGTIRRELLALRQRYQLPVMGRQESHRR